MKLALVMVMEGNNVKIITLNTWAIEEKRVTSQTQDKRGNEEGN